MAKSDGSVVIEIKGDSSNFKKEIESLGKYVKSSFSGAIDALSNSVGNVAEAEKKLSGDFESSMLQISKSSSAAGISLDGLGETIYKIDGQAQFGALEASKALSALAISGNDVRTSTNALPALLDNTAVSTRVLSEASDSAASASLDFGNASKSAFENLSKVIATVAIVNAIKNIAQAFHDCVGTFAEFESQMSSVQAISGATSAEMQMLSEKAQEMGATTAFTATEAAQALEYMAMAGWNTQDMMDGLSGVMNLAAASGEDLAMVSDILTDGLTAFGLSASESAHFADVLAAASSKSNTNVSQMGESFKYVAPVAGSLGMSIEDVAVALGLMANAGVKGSMSGTALRSTLTNLAKPSEQVAGYMKSLGISLTDNSGKVRSLAEIMSILREKFSELTEAQKAQYAAGIAGQEAMSGLLAIVNASDEDFQALTASINNCAGAAEEMAKIRLDNYAGQVTLLNSAIDGLKMTIGSQLAPVLKLMAKGATEAVGGLNTLLKVCPPLSALLVGMFANVVALTAAFVGMQVIRTITPMIQAFNAAMAANPAIATAAAIIGVVTALGTLAAYCVDAMNGVDSLNGKMREINATYQESEAQTLATVEAANSLIDKLVALEAQESLTTGEAALYAQTVDKLRTLMPELNLEIDEQTGLLIGGAEALRAQTEAWKENALAQAMQEKYRAVLEEQAEALITVAEKQMGYNDALATCTDIERQLEEASKALQEVEADSSLTYEEKEMRVNELNQKMGELSNQYVTARDNLNAQDDAMQKAQQTADAFDAELKKLDDTQAALNGTLQNTGNSIQEFESYISSVVSSIETLNEAYEEAAATAMESIQSQFGMWENLGDTAISSTEDMKAALQSQETFWKSYSSNLDNLLSRNVDGLDELLSATVDYSQESASKLAGLRWMTDEELGEMVSLYRSVQDVQSETAHSAAELETQYSERMRAIGRSAANAAAEMDISPEMKKVGEDAMNGLIEGIEGKESQLNRTIQRIMKSIEDASRKALDSHSPSRVFRDIGSDTIEGFEVGVEGRSGTMQQTMKQSALDAAKSFQSNADIDISISDVSKISADMRKELQAVMDEMSLSVAAEVGGVSSKLAASVGGGGSSGGEPAVVTNENGVVVNLNYYGSSEPEDIRKISRQIGIEAAKEIRRRGGTA